MSRPIKDGLEYFPHDTDAASDEKVEAIMSVHGPAGYAFYFILLERIYKTTPPEVDLSKPAIRAMLARKICLTLEQFEAILETALDLGLFDQKTYRQRQVLTSPGAQKRHEAVEAMRQKWRDKKRPKQEEEDIPEVISDVFQEVIPEESTTEQAGEGYGFSPGKTEQETQGKGTQRKGKERKVKQTSTTPLTPQGGPPKDDVDCDAVVAFYHTACPRLPKVKVLSDKRRRCIRARVKEHGKAAVMQVLMAAGESSFLAGDNDRKWTADLEWLMTAGNFVKVLEGNRYRNRASPGFGKHGGGMEEILRVAMGGAEDDGAGDCQTYDVDCGSVS